MPRHSDNNSQTARKATAKHSVLLGFAFRERGPKGRWQIRFRWARILTTLGILTVCVYVAGITSIYFILKYKKNYEEANYWHTYTLPFRLKEHKKDMGEYQIEKAKKILENTELTPQKRFRGAFQNLRAGVPKSPANLEGRMMLAEMFLLSKNEEMGMSVLQQGVKYGHSDFKYLQFYLRILFRSKKDNEIIQLAERILATEPKEDIAALLAIGAATAHQKRGNFDRAEDYIETYNVDDKLEGTLLSAQINWDRGQKNTAIAKLQSSIDKFPNKEPIYARISTFYREIGEYEKARAETVKRIANAPLRVAPKIDLLHILRYTGEEERADREAEAILSQYKTSETSLLSLASYAAEFGLVDLIRRIYAQALELDYDIGPFALMLIEANIENNDFETAIKFTEELDKERPDWLDNQWAIFNSLRSVAHYGQGNKDLSTIYLNQFLKEANIRVESLLAVSDAFQELGGKNEARTVLLQAYNNNPDNQVALSSLVKLELELGNSANLGSYLRQLLKMRRPSIDILDKAYRELGSDRFIFTQDRDTLLIELNSILNPKPGNTSSPS